MKKREIKMEELPEILLGSSSSILLNKGKYKEVTRYAHIKNIDTNRFFVVSYVREMYVLED